MDDVWTKRESQRRRWHDESDTKARCHRCDSPRRIRVQQQREQPRWTWRRRETGRLSWLALRRCFAAPRRCMLALLLLLLLCSPTFLVLAQVALIGSLPAYDVTTHIGNPENAPPPGIEFLGSGYDIVNGNPLDEQGEAFLDPGMRLPAIELLFDVRRTAGAFQEPLGTSLKRAPVCKYATLAQEVATVSAYQQLLALDVTVLNEFGGTEAPVMPVPPVPPGMMSSSSTGAGPPGRGNSGPRPPDRPGAAPPPQPPGPGRSSNNAAADGNPARVSSTTTTTTTATTPLESGDQAASTAQSNPAASFFDGLLNLFTSSTTAVPAAALSHAAAPTITTTTTTTSSSDSPLSSSSSSSPPVVSGASDALRDWGSSLAQRMGFGGGARSLPALSPRVGLQSSMLDLRAQDAAADAQSQAVGLPNNKQQASLMNQGQIPRTGPFATQQSQTRIPQPRAFQQQSLGSMHLPGESAAPSITTSSLGGLSQWGAEDAVAPQGAGGGGLGSMGHLNQAFSSMFWHPTTLHGGQAGTPVQTSQTWTNVQISPPSQQQPQQQQPSQPSDSTPQQPQDDRVSVELSATNAADQFHAVSDLTGVAPPTSRISRLAVHGGSASATGVDAASSPSSSSVPPAASAASPGITNHLGDGNGGTSPAGSRDDFELVDPTPPPSHATGSTGGGDPPVYDRSPDKQNGPPTSPLGTAFSGSFTFIDTRQNLEEKDQIAFYSRALCIEYQVEFRSFIPPLLTENFANAIAFLPDFVPDELDDSDRAADARMRFRAVIQEFGTHYIHRLVAGGKRVVTTLLSSASVASLKEKNVNVALGAAFVPGGFNNATAMSSNNFTFASQQQNYEAMSSQIQSRIETTIGGLPFINFYGWAVTVPERTTPIQYTLKPLYSLLPTGPKRTALKIVISAYVNSAGKYPSVDNRAGTGYGSVSEEAPTPSPIFNNLMRTSPVTQRP